ncbi:MAG: diguanylate cyclase [Desulfobacterales bacterium]|nr:diguanylate cyclase [Desulfobacterales bacterium]
MQITDFQKFSISTKIIFGYLPIFIVMMLITIIALSSLTEANKTSKNIVEYDIVLLESANHMIDSLLAQESYGRRYLILGSREMLDLFRQRSKEFNAFVTQIQALKGSKNIPSKQLYSLHNEFNNLYEDWIKDIDKESSAITKEYDAKIKNKLDELMAFIQKMIDNVKQDQSRLIIKTSDAGLKTFRITVMLSSIGLILGIGALTLTTRNISRSIQQLKLATRKISEGKFDHIPDVKARDELGELANAFIKMAQRLACLEEANLNANPLTRLPGGIAIENVLKNKLTEGGLVAFCLLDLDNFKSFNDNYGYALGNEVIKTTAKIIKTTVVEYGSGDDFVGHIGGDDFAIITTPKSYRVLCKQIIKEFDKKIIDFYNADDKSRGYIVGKTRQGQEVKFPIMSVSIAVVATHRQRQMNHIKIGEIAAEIKEHAKTIPGSVFIVNRREKTT